MVDASAQALACLTRAVSIPRGWFLEEIKLQFRAEQWHAEPVFKLLKATLCVWMVLNRG